MKTLCRQCGKDSGGLTYCSSRCKGQWHNQNRVLPINVRGKCETCGRSFAKNIAPSRIAAGYGRFCNRTCAGAWRRGENHPNWNGGEKIDREGYILAWVGHEHPHNRNGYIRKHRLVMERKVGRFLDPIEVVHHKNGNVQDNRLANLVLYASNAEHKAEDIHERKRDKCGRLLPTRK